MSELAISTAVTPAADEPSAQSAAAGHRAGHGMGRGLRRGTGCHRDRAVALRPLPLPCWPRCRRASPPSTSPRSSRPCEMQAMIEAVEERRRSAGHAARGHALATGTRAHARRDPGGLPMCPAGAGRGDRAATHRLHARTQEAARTGQARRGGTASHSREHALRQPACRNKPGQR